jgi:hypothetical protein
MAGLGVEENAVQRALRLPEILDAVLDNLGCDRSALNAACRTSRLWAAVALPLLWRRVPHAALEGPAAQRSGVFDAAIHQVDVEVLRPTQCRRRFGLLGRLGLRRGPVASLATPQWTLPRVHRLTCTYGDTSLVAAAPRMSEWIVRLAPRLTAVAFAHDWRAGAPVMTRRMRIAAALGFSAGVAFSEGPGLGSFIRVDSDDSNDVVDDNDSNHAGDGGGGHGEGSVLRLLAQLARCPNLRELSLAPVVTGSTAEYVLRAGLEPLFLRLRVLDLNVSSWAFARLWPLCSSVTQLHLTINHGRLDTDSIFASVSGMLQLCSLTLLDVDIPAAGVLPRLRALSALVELNLSGGVRHGLAEDNEILALVSGLPRLRVLKLFFCACSARVLTILSQCCAELRHLELSGVYRAIAEPDCIGTTQPLFPQLETLIVLDARCGPGPDR